MNLESLIKENPGINITIAAGELFEFGQQIADKTAKTILAKDEVKVYTRKEIIEKFSISSVSLWRWEKMGLVKSQKIGGRLYFTEHEIKSLIGQKGGSK
jgi:hypothetical protein